MFIDMSMYWEFLIPKYNIQRNMGTIRLREQREVERFHKFLQRNY